MTVDRWGTKTRIDYSEVEIIYLKAAMTLPRGERFQAFREIAELYGRNPHAVQDRAYRLHNQELARWAEERAKLVPARSLPKVPGLPASALRRPSEAEKMAGKAIVRRRPIAT